VPLILTVLFGLLLAGAIYFLKNKNLNYNKLEIEPKVKK